MPWRTEEKLPRDDLRQAVVLTGGQIVAQTGTCENTVRKWMRDGTLPTVKIGGRVFVPAQAFLRLFGDDGQ